MTLTATCSSISNDNNKVTNIVLPSYKLFLRRLKYLWKDAIILCAYAIWLRYSSPYDAIRTIRTVYILYSCFSVFPYPCISARNVIFHSVCCCNRARLWCIKWTLRHRASSLAVDECNVFKLRRADLKVLNAKTSLKLSVGVECRRLDHLAMLCFFHDEILSTASNIRWFFLMRRTSELPPHLIEVCNLWLPDVDVHDATANREIITSKFLL